MDLAWEGEAAERLVVFTIRSMKSNFKAKKMPSSDNFILKKQCRCFNLLPYISGMLVFLVDVFRNKFLKEKSRCRWEGEH